MELKKADDVRLSIEIFLLHYINENKDSKVEVNRQVIINDTNESSYIRIKNERKKYIHRLCGKNKKKRKKY